MLIGGIVHYPIGSLIILGCICVYRKNVARNFRRYSRRTLSAFPPPRLAEKEKQTTFSGHIANYRLLPRLTFRHIFCHDFVTGFSATFFYQTVFHLKVFRAIQFFNSLHSFFNIICSVWLIRLFLIFSSLCQIASQKENPELQN